MPNRPDFLILLSAALLSGCGSENTGNAPAATEPSASVAQSVPDVEQMPATPETTASEPEADECGAGKLGRWLNVLPTETVKAEIVEAVGHDRVRYIEPGGMVTMDFVPDRLNVETGVDGRIKLFRCG